MTGSPVSARRLPAVSLPDLEGVYRPLAESWAAGGALVVLGHRDCGTTRLALPYVDRLHRRRGAAAPRVLAILQDDPDAARELVANLELSLPVRLEEPPYALSRELKLQTVPTLFLVDPEGGIERSAEGFCRQDFEELAARLGVPPPFFTAEDKAPPLRPG